MIALDLFATSYCTVQYAIAHMDALSTLSGDGAAEHNTQSP